MASGLPHRVGRRQLRQPPRAGEVSHPWVLAAGSGELGCGAGQQSTPPRIESRTIHRVGGITRVRRFVAIPLSRRCRSVHRSPDPGRQTGCLLAGVHPPLVRCCVLPRGKRSVLSLPSRAVQSRRRSCRRATDPPATPCATGAAGRPDLRDRNGDVMSFRSQGTTLFAAILALVASAVVVQLWLLTVSMEALLGGHYNTLIPAAAGST